MARTKIFPFLWYAKNAEEAAKFYASIFPDSHVEGAAKLESESPSGPPGSVKIVEFVLFGQLFTSMSAGPLDRFNHAVSLRRSTQPPARAPGTATDAPTLKRVKRPAASMSL